MLSTKQLYPSKPRLQQRYLDAPLSHSTPTDLNFSKMLLDPSPPQYHYRIKIHTLDAALTPPSLPSSSPPSYKSPAPVPPPSRPRNATVLPVPSATPTPSSTSRSLTASSNPAPTASPRRYASTSTPHAHALPYSSRTTSGPCDSTTPQGTRSRSTTWRRRWTRSRCTGRTTPSRGRRRGMYGLIALRLGPGSRFTRSACSTWLSCWWSGSCGAVRGRERETG